GRTDAVNPSKTGTKAGAYYKLEIPAGESMVLRLRLNENQVAQGQSFDDFDALFAQRIQEADAFYLAHTPIQMTEEARRVQRQAYAGLLWTKQLYIYDVDRWLKGDPTQPAPPANRYNGRNHDWTHLS